MSNYSCLTFFQLFSSLLHSHRILNDINRSKKSNDYLLLVQNSTNEKRKREGKVVAVAKRIRLKYSDVLMKKLVALEEMNWQRRCDICSRVQE